VATNTNNPGTSLSLQGALQYLKHGAGTIVVLGINGELDCETKRIVDARRGLLGSRLDGSRCARALCTGLCDVS
jgi:hypothetical protein